MPAAGETASTFTAKSTEGLPSLETVLRFAPARVVRNVHVGDPLPGTLVDLISEDGSVPLVSFGEDPDASSWLILPADQGPGEVRLDYQQNLPVGTYSTTLIATSDGYTSGEMQILIEIFPEGSDLPPNEGGTDAGPPDVNTTLTTTMRVNFGTQDMADIDGYLKDFGRPFSIQGTRNYGWVVPNTSTPLSLVGNGRNRPPTPDVDVREETIMHMQYDDLGANDGQPVEGAWEIELDNGTYEVTAITGDRQAESFDGTRYVIRAEGVNLFNNLAVQGAVNRYKGTKTVEVSDGRLTIDASGGTNTKLIYLIITPVEGQPFAFFSTPVPANGATEVSPFEFQMTVNVVTSNGYSLDKATIANHVKLFERTVSGELVEIPSNSNDTGGNDAITLTPSRRLDYLTEYVFTIEGAEAFRDTDLSLRIPFENFTSTFTTATQTGTTPPQDLEGVSFTQVRGADVGEGINDRFSSLVIGPDRKLYAATTGEVIKRWDINEDGTLSNLEVLPVDLTGATDPRNGTALPDERIIIGLAFDPASTAENLIAYVTHSASVLAEGPAWDGKVTRLSGANLSEVQDMLIHLPRSTKDHLTNSVVFDGAGKMYIVQGSNSAGGEPDPRWSNRRERLLSAAVLKVDLNLLRQQPLPLSLFTTDDIGIINSAPANSIRMTDGTYNPYSLDSPVTLFATGLRNAYDMVWHSNGWLYLPTNGTAGDGEVSPNSPASINYIVPGFGVRRADGSFFTDASIPALRGGETQKDWLFKSKGGSYHGHPNPYRGEFVLNHGGRPYSGLPGQRETEYTDVQKYPDNLGPDPNYLEVAYDFGKNKSPNGAIEYKSNAFGGTLRGMLMVARFSGQDDVVAMQPSSASGDIITTYPDIPGLQGLDDPLDVIEDVRTGNLYVSEYDRDGGSSSFALTLLRADVPASPEATISSNPEEALFEVTRNTDGRRTDGKLIFISNTGEENLIIGGVQVTGPDAGKFRFQGPMNLTLAPGGVQLYRVTYAPASDSPLGYHEAGLTFSSNASNDPVFTVGLHGLMKEGFTGRQEPPLQAIVDALGVSIDVGWTTLNTTVSNDLMGDEVEVPLFEPAAAGILTLTPLARYSDNEIAPFGWYTNLGGEVVLHEVGQLGNTLANAQRLYPQLSAGTTTFSSQGAFFGIYVNGKFRNQIHYTEDALNQPANNGNRHRARVYPAKDRSGNLLPNTYLIAFELASSGDYQEYVFLLENAKPFDAESLQLTFSRESVDIIVEPGEVSDAVSASVSANAGLNANNLTINASEPWLVLPNEVVLDQDMQFRVNAFDLPEGTYEATVTVDAPGFDPAVLRVVTRVQRPSAFSAFVNFQDVTFDPPTDYVADIGKPYANRNNGFTYGWIDPVTKAPNDNTARARGAARNVTNRSSRSIKLLHSLNILDLIRDDAPRDWEIKVPNGRYEVEVAVGDPFYYDSEHVLRVEGVTVINRFKPNDAEPFRVGRATVVVRDGKLTVDDFGATEVGNTKINYINIVPADRDDRPTVVATLSGRETSTGAFYQETEVTLTATDGANTGGIANLRYRIDGGAYADYETPFQVSLGAGLARDTFLLEAEATDNDGNIHRISREIVLLEATGAVLRYENLVKVPGTNRGFPAEDFFSFSRLQAQVNSIDGPLVFHEQSNVRLHNDGINPLVITGLTTTDTSNFIVSGLDIPETGITILPGGSVDATVQFIRNDGPAPKIYTAYLQVESNAENEADVRATLRGAYSDLPEGNNEISAQQLFETYNLRTEMGRDRDGRFVTRPASDYPSDERVDSGAEGDMILSDFFVAANPSQPVRMLQIAALHGPETAGISLRNTQGASLGFSYRHALDYHQSILPRLAADENALAGAVGAVDVPFLISIANYRTTGGNNAQELSDEILGIRVYRVLDKDGNVVPNEYIVNQDYILNGCGAGSSNCDWNDNTSYIFNARPLGRPTAGVIADREVPALFDRTYDVSGAFDKGYPGNRLFYSAALADGSVLPEWINIDELTGTFTINAPFSTIGRRYDVTVTVRDYNQLTASSTFELRVFEGTYDCEVNANADGEAKVVGCSGQTVRLSGFSSTGVYQWTGPNGFRSTEQNPIVNLAGVYILRSDSGDPTSPCPTTDQVVVTDDCNQVSELWLEAECATIGNQYVTASYPTASGNRVVYAANMNSTSSPPADIAANRIRFVVEGVSPGAYSIFGRVRGDNTTFDSYWVRVNGGEWFLWFWREDDPSGLVWSQVSDGTYNLTGGIDIIDFAYREQDVFLDKIHLNKTGVMPSGVGEAASNCGNAANQRPVASASFSVDNSTQPAAVRLNGAASQDPDGTIVSYSWRIDGGIAITGVSPTVNLNPGTYTAVLTVTDNEGATDSEEFIIFIEEPGATTDVFWLEAECAVIGDNFSVKTHPSGSGGNVVYSRNDFSTGTPPADVPANRVRFIIDNAEPGDYSLYGRVRGDMTSRDSYWVRVNGGEWILWFWREMDPSGLVWSEVFDGPFALTGGVNTIDFAFREPDVFFDKIHLNTDGTFPTGQGGTATNCSDGSDDATNIWLEAECADVGDRFFETSHPNASNGRIVYVPGEFSHSAPPADVAENRVRFTVSGRQAGDYHLFARVRGDFTNFDSYWVRVNGGEWILWFWRVDDASGLVWAEVFDGPFTLSGGTNTIDFAFREQDVYLDKIHLNQSGDLPEGPGVGASNCGGDNLVEEDSVNKESRAKSDTPVKDPVATLRGNVVTDELLTAYPNPVRERLFFRLRNDYDGPVRAIVVSMNGTTVYTTDLQKQGNELSGALPTAGLPSGPYLLRLVSGKKFQQTRFIKLP